MKILFVYLTLLVLAALMIPGCSRESADRLAAAANACDTTHVGYNDVILPIVQQYCYPCHSSANTAFGDGISLDGYDALKGWTAAGYVIGNVTHASGYIGMPYGKPKLDDCTINKIIAWAGQQYPK